MSEELFIDQPIKSSRDDLFGRKEFAGALAKTIMNWDGEESLVIAISGNYGSGKTSLKNMMVEQLRNDNEKAPYLVEFNPWEWSKQDKLTEAFFREISLALVKVKSKKKYELAKTMERYGQFLTFSAEVASDFSNISPSIFSGVAGFSLFAYSTQGYPILSKSMVVISGCLAIIPLLKLLGGLLKKFGRFFGGADEIALEDQKAKLRNELKNLEKPVLVIIDDIDRLDKEETQTLFKVLKVNADFPKFAYLLLYQREAVERNLEDVQLKTGDFLTKAVHLPLDIPSIPEMQVHKVLSDGLKKILSRIGINELDEKRWGNLFLGALKPYFNNLRSVKRFLSTFSVYVGLFKGTKTFEINVIDLIGVETVRVFEPDLYQRLAQSKYLLTHLVPDPVRENTKQEEVRSFLNLVDESKREYVQELIKQLFPTVERVFGGYTYGAEFYEKWREDLRICSDQVFDRYFQFEIQGGDLSESDLDELLDATANREEFKSKFRTLVERGLQNITLSRLDDKKQKISINNAPIFLPALFDLGDEIADNSDFMEISPPIYLLRIVWWYLMNEPSVLNRYTLFCKAITESGGLSLGARIIRNNMELREEKNTKPQEFLFDDNTLNEAKNLWLKKVRDIAKNTPQQLINITSLPLVLYFWSELGSKEETQKFISLAIKTDDGLLIFLRGMTQNVKSFTSGDYVSTQGIKIKLDEIDKFASIDLIEARVNSLEIETLSSQDKEIMDVFNETLKKRKQGNNRPLSKLEF
jgi:predicted KAP-like P-loop ATPase